MKGKLCFINKPNPVGSLSEQSQLWLSKQLLRTTHLISDLRQVLFFQKFTTDLILLD